MARSASLLLHLLLLVAVGALAQPARGRQASKARGTRPPASNKAGARVGPAGTWIGQDGKDVVGPSSDLGPSEIQDIHIALTGLPRDRTIQFAQVSATGGEWTFNGPRGPWRAQIEREVGSPTADVYLEPNQDETGRPFHVLLQMDDGRKLEFDVQGGRARQGLKLVAAPLAARWLGQDRQDRVGPGPSVGPDGLVDCQIALSNISRTVPIASVEIRGGGGQWQSGVNLKGVSNAEIVRDGKDSSRADVFLESERDLAGQALQVVVRYVNGKSDSAKLVAGKLDPKKKVARPRVPSANVVRLSGRWHGQTGQNLVGPGDVHVTLTGLPQAPISAAVLSDPSRGVWAFKGANAAGLEGLEFATPMALHQDDSGAVDLFFPPVRDETGGKMMLRVILGDGRVFVGEFPGGPADVSLRAGDGPGDSLTTARPGDDLQSLVARQGTIRLATGRHLLKRPLVLEKPVRIIGDSGSVLVFSQDASEPEWSAAIKIHSGLTTLEGFSIRFASPVRWKAGIEYGPAVIGASDNSDPNQGNLKAGLVFRKLDVEGPPASGPLVEAPRTIRLHRCVNGRIEQCTLKGGTIELDAGPWRIADNRFIGTMPGTFSYGVIAAHMPHDLIVKDNIARPAADSGKVWRFLALTGLGDNDLIEGNQIEGIGPRDDDTIPGMNAPEIIVTESYSLHFEGKPLAIGTDGRILMVPPLQGEPANTGDVVAILSGPHAGQWRRISQTLGPAIYLMDTPLPSGDYVVSIATGFVRETIRKNRIDSRGGTVAGNLVLVGNLYGLTVQGNHLLGGGAFKITAAPTEHPVHWGWSHAPLLGFTFEDNILEDSIGGGDLNVEHSEYIKSSQGRVYATAVVKGNTIRWSKEFLAKHASSPPRKPLAGITLGVEGSLDPAELAVTEENNRVEGRDSPAIRVVAAKVNGKELRDRAISSAAESGGSADASSKARKR